MRAVVTVSLDDETVEKAKKYASSTGRTFSGLVELSLANFIKREVDHCV